MLADGPISEIKHLDCTSPCEFCNGEWTKEAPRILHHAPNCLYVQVEDVLEDTTDTAAFMRRVES